MDVPARLFLWAPLLLMVILPYSVKSLFIDNDFQKEKVTTPKTFPFRVFWNVPDTPCIVKYPHANMKAKLASYGIEGYYDEKQGTDAVTIYYGGFKWPRIKHGTWFNGGLPQHADVEGHLSAVREKVNQIKPPDRTGLGVLDMEAFRPLLFGNYGGLRFLRDVQLNETATLYPNITSKQELRAKAEEAYETGARDVMEATLREVIKVRPNMKWGYYDYPSYSFTTKQNDRISWLWNITTAYYPRLYIQNSAEPYVDSRQQALISETFRVRAKYGDPDAPMYGYQFIHNEDGYFYNHTLYEATDATIQKGADGIVFWASSSLFHNNVSLQCERYVSYVDNFLGPRIAALRKQMTDCSNQLCGGHGRCVSQFYVGKIEHILDRGLPQPEIPLKSDKRPDWKTTKKEFLDNYACQCHKNWTGRWCRLERKLQSYDIGGNTCDFLLFAQ